MQPTWTRLVRWVALLLLLAATATVAAAPRGVRARNDGSRELTAAEQASLRAGKLVVRPEQRAHGRLRLIGGLAWQAVDASPARVWETMAHVASYPRFLPAVVEARVVARRGDEQTLFIRHEVGFVRASYHVLAVPDPRAGRMRFRMDHSYPSSIEDAWGELRVSPYGQGKSVVSLAIMADVGGGFVAGFLRGEVHEWMLRIPEQLKRFVEKRR